MSFIGGDVLEATCSHPILGNFRFLPKAGEAFTSDKGGLRTADEAGSITGSGQPIWGMSRVRWSVEGPIANDFGTEREENALNDLAAHPDPGTWTFTYVGGAIRRGLGKPVGDINADTMTTLSTLKVSGGGKLEKIA